MNSVNIVNFNLTTGLKVGGAIAFSAGTVVAVVGAVVFGAWFLPQAGVGVIGNIQVGSSMLVIGLLLDGVGVALLLLFFKRKQTLPSESIKRDESSSSCASEPSNIPKADGTVSNEKSESDDDSEPKDNASSKITMHLEFTVQQEKESSSGSSDRKSRVALSKSRPNIKLNKKCKVLSIDSLPDEIVLYIFGFLSPKSLSKSSQVNHKWRAISQENCLWKKHCGIAKDLISKNEKPREAFFRYANRSVHLSNIRTNKIFPHEIELSELDKLAQLPNKSYKVFFGLLQVHSYFMAFYGSRSELKAIVKVFNFDKKNLKLTLSINFNANQLQVFSSNVILIDKDHIGSIRDDHYLILNLKNGGSVSKKLPYKLKTSVGTPETIYLAQETGVIEKWDWKENKITPLFDFANGEEQSNLVKMFISGDRLYALFTNNVVRFWDLSSGISIPQIFVSPCRDISMCNNLIFFLTRSNKVKIFTDELKYCASFTVSQIKRAKIFSIAFMQDRYLIISKFGKITVLDKKKDVTTKIVLPFSKPLKLVTKGNCLLGIIDNRTYLIDFINGNYRPIFKREFKLHLSKSSKLKVMVDEPSLVSRISGKKLQIWDLDNPQLSPKKAKGK